MKCPKCGSEMETKDWEVAEHGGVIGYYTTVFRCNCGHEEKVKPDEK